MDTKTLLQNQTNALLQQLIDLAGKPKSAKQAEADRLTAENIVSDLRAAERAAQSADPPKGTKYAHYHKTIDAIEACLDEKGIPTRASVVKRELIEGGFRPSIQTRDKEMDTQKSITVCIRGGRLKSFDGGETIGRGNWPNSLFRR